MNKQKRTECFARFKAQNPHPTTELLYDTVFELLVAVVLSAQSTDVAVNKATRLLFKVANTPSQIRELTIEGVKPYIKTLGLFNNKAKHIIAMCDQLLDRHQGRVPTDRKNLEALPGVGRKTANVILNTAFNQPVIAVDTHIFRVSNRTGLAKGLTVAVVEKQLMNRVPKDFLLNAHHWLILQGRYVCLARKPRCRACIIEDLCDFKDKTEE